MNNHVKDVWKWLYYIEYDAKYNFNDSFTNKKYSSVDGIKNKLEGIKMAISAYAGS